MSKSKKRNKKQNRQAHNDNKGSLDIVSKVLSSTLNDAGITSGELIFEAPKNNTINLNVKMFKNSEKQPPKENDKYLVLYEWGCFGILSWTKKGWNTNYYESTKEYFTEAKFDDEEVIYWGAIPQYEQNKELIIRSKKQDDNAK